MENKINQPLTKDYHKVLFMLNCETVQIRNLTREQKLLSYSSVITWCYKNTNRNNENVLSIELITTRFMLNKEHRCTIITTNLQQIKQHLYTTTH